MKSTIFEGISERLAEIKREEGRTFSPHEVSPRITPQHITKALEKRANPPIVDPVGYCSVYGHNISIHAGVCVRCGHKPYRV